MHAKVKLKNQFYTPKQPCKITSCSAPVPPSRVLTLRPPPAETQRVRGDSLAVADVDIAGPLDAAAARGVVQKAALRIVEEEAEEASAAIPAADGILKTCG